MSDVLLVSMPFGPLHWPSIGLTLLRAGLEREGIEARVRYFNLGFAGAIGEPLYSRISTELRLALVDLPGEWVFAGALFGEEDEAAEKYFAAVGQWHAAWGEGTWVRRPRLPPPARLRAARARVEGFLAACLEDIAAAPPRLLGLTSVFQQHVPSLALARRVKERWPEITVVLGGPACEGVMGAETVRRFGFVDAVVSGEGDLVFPELVKRALAGEPLAGLPGVRTRAGLAAEAASGRYPNAPSVTRMDDLPPVAYHDFAAQFAATRLGRRYAPSLLVETARGCWFGARSHCTFCGLNGETMAFRSKSPERVLAELEGLAGRHPGSKVMVVDNILDRSYLTSLLPALARRRLPLDLYWEVKSNLRQDEVRLLRAAGVGRIQPGIESLSDAVLRRMRKGVTALQNLQLLRWCKEAGLEVDWNFLWGFPGEEPEEYAAMAALVPRLVHLPPPDLAAGILLDRFSPLFVNAAAEGLVDVEPFPSLGRIYPLPAEALANLAYHFRFRYRDGRQVADYVAPLTRAIRAWQRHHAASDLFTVDLGRALLVSDLRPGAPEALFAIDGIERALVEACTAVREARALAEAVAVPVEKLPSLAAPLVRRGIVVNQGSRYLSLALPLGEYQPAPPVRARFWALVRARARREGGDQVVPLPAPAPAPAKARSGASRVARARRIVAGELSLEPGGALRIRRP